MTQLKQNTVDLDALIAKANALPNVGSGNVSIVKSLIRRGLGYIDTGIDAANSNITIEVRYEFEKKSTGYFYIIRAYEEESTNSTRILINQSSNATYCCLNSSPSASLSVTNTIYLDVVYTDILKPENDSVFSYTANGKKSTKARTSGDALVGKNILLFTNAETDDNTVVKVHHLKISDGDTLLRYLLPFVTKDGECGMYDLVTKQFYGNAGVGTFEAEIVEVTE